MPDSHRPDFNRLMEGVGYPEGVQSQFAREHWESMRATTTWLAADLVLRGAEALGRLPGVRASAKRQEEIGYSNLVRSGALRDGTVVWSRLTATRPDPGSLQPGNTIDVDFGVVQPISTAIRPEAILDGSMSVVPRVSTEVSVGFRAVGFDTRQATWGHAADLTPGAAYLANFERTTRTEEQVPRIGLRAVATLLGGHQQPTVEEVRTTQVEVGLEPGTLTQGSWTNTTLDGEDRPDLYRLLQDSIVRFSDSPDRPHEGVIRGGALSPDLVHGHISQAATSVGRFLGRVTPYLHAAEQQGRRSDA